MLRQAMAEVHNDISVEIDGQWREFYDRQAARLAALSESERRLAVADLIRGFEAEDLPAKRVEDFKARLSQRYSN